MKTQSASTQALFQKYVQECKDCADRKIPVVYCPTRRINKMASSLADVKSAAEAAGLRFGGSGGLYVANRPD